MKSLKVFIGVSSVLLLVALGAGVYVWYAVQEYQKSLAGPEEVLVPAPVNTVENVVQ